MLEIGDFFGINTDLRINPNSIPHTVGAAIFQVEKTREIEMGFILKSGFIPPKTPLSFTMGTIIYSWNLPL